MNASSFAAMLELMKLFAFVLAAAVGLPANAGAADKPIFAVVVSRHGVRSLTSTPASYQWADWSPVENGFLTAHGYRLMTAMGAFYRTYFTALGIPVNCAARNAFVYADRAQRPYESARAIVEGMCGNASAIAVAYDADLHSADPMFDASDYFVPLGTFDPSASAAAVRAAEPKPPSAVLTRYAGSFDALQSILNARCSATCTPVTSGAFSVAQGTGLAEQRGPVQTASKYAESLFLEYAQCRATAAFSSGSPTDLARRFQSIMELHVLAYGVNARNAYNPLVRGGNLFAHIVGLLEERAGQPAVVRGPDVSNDNVTFVVGHDTQVAALAGIMDAHWRLQHGLADDDMPPGGALIFELLRTSSGTNTVRVIFASQSPDQMRKNAPDKTPTFDIMTVPLHTLRVKADSIAARGFVLPDWTPYATKQLQYPPLADPPWTACQS